MSVQQAPVTELHEEEKPLTKEEEEDIHASLQEYHRLMKDFTPQHSHLLNLIFANHAMTNKLHQAKGEPEETLDQFMKREFPNE
jgi:hypothetical protein